MDGSWFMAKTNSSLKMIRFELHGRGSLALAAVESHRGVHGRRKGAGDNTIRLSQVSANVSLWMSRGERNSK